MYNEASGLVNKDVMHEIMDIEKEKHLVDAWLTAIRAGGSSSIYEANWWAIEAFMELPSEDPELLWKSILIALEKEDDLKVLGVLAAGPFEDLMCEYGEKIIDRVEEEAKNNPKFIPFMQGVLLSSEDTTVWKRFYELAGIEPPFPEEYRPIEEYERSKKS